MKSGGPTMSMPKFHSCSVKCATLKSRYMTHAVSSRHRRLRVPRSYHFVHNPHDLPAVFLERSLIFMLLKTATARRRGAPLLPPRPADLLTQPTQPPSSHYQKPTHLRAGVLVVVVPSFCLGIDFRGQLRLVAAKRRRR